MLNKYHLISLFMLSTSFLLFGKTIVIQNNNNTYYDKKIITQSEKEIIIELSINQFKLQEELVADKQYSSIILSESDYYTHAPGFPKLPVIKIPIALPDGYKIKKVNIQKNGIITYKNIENVLPVQRDYLENAERPPFELNDAYYKSNDDYPKKIEFVSEIQQLREIRFVPIEVVPFSFNPAQKQLSVISKIRITLDLIEDGTKVSQQIVKKEIKERNNGLYKKLFDNYNDEFVKMDNITIKN